MTLPTDTIPCWNCDCEMRCFAQDTIYWHYRCPECEKERLQMKEEIQKRMGIEEKKS